MTRPDLCLEFVNTRYWRGQATPTETLHQPEDLAAWSTANGGPKGAKPLARKEFDQAIELREMIHRLFDAEAQDKAPAARDLEALNHALAEAPARTTLRRERGLYGWDVDIRSGTALAMLAPSYGRQAICWRARGSTGCAAAPIPNAAGSSSTIAAPANGAGARCRAAATGPRPSGTITRAGRAERPQQKGPREGPLICIELVERVSAGCSATSWRRPCRLRS
jgi:hypothetical protein